MSGILLAIHLSPRGGDPMRRVEAVRAVPGRGLEGDRYFLGRGTYSDRPDRWSEVTLVEWEALEAIRRDYGIELEPGEARRNLIVRGVPLNHLVGREFRVGEVRLLGTRLCEPCGHLERLTRPGVRRALVHRGGLRAAVLAEGTIRTGDPVVWNAGPPGPGSRAGV